MCDETSDKKGVCGKNAMINTRWIIGGAGIYKV
jgi:hypothetical protein